VILAEQPLVVACGARLTREVRIEAHETARVMHRETLVLGRHDEEGGAVCARSRVTRGGRPVLDDTLDTADLEVRRSPVVLGAARVVATLSLFGCDVAPEGFALASDDQLVRRLAATTSELGTLEALQRRWGAAVLA
jgi:urease accessory protein